MLDESAGKKCYSELIKLFLGRPEEFPENLKERFDFVTGTAILAEGHLMGGAIFDEMLLTLKKNGFAIFTTRDEYMTKYGYEEAIKLLVEAGKWKKVHDATFVKYHNIAEGQTIGRF